MAPIPQAPMPATSIIKAIERHTKRLKFIQFVNSAVYGMAAGWSPEAYTYIMEVEGHIVQIKITKAD